MLKHKAQRSNKEVKVKARRTSMNINYKIAIIIFVSFTVHFLYAFTLNWHLSSIFFFSFIRLPGGDGWMGGKGGAEAGSTAKLNRVAARISML